MKKQSMLFKVTIFAVVFFLLSILPLKCQAQMTTVSSTGIVDSDTTTWAKATLTFTFLPNPNYPNVKPTPLSYSTTANSSGAFTLAVPDNNYVSVGSTYQLVICSQTSAPCSVLPAITITGSTQDLTTFINSGIAAPRFAANWYGAYGYADIEVSPTPLAGQTYYNVITPVTRQWNGSAWSSAGGGAVSSVFTRTGAVVATASDYAAYYLKLDGSNSMSSTINEVNPSAGTANLLNLSGNAGNWASFIVQENANNLVFYSQNQYSGNAAWLDVSPSLNTALGNLGPGFYAYGLGISCASGDPNSACVGGFLQTPGSGVLNLSADYHGTNPTTLNVIGNVNSTYIKSSTYTVATLPSAATAGAGYQVTVTDASTFTPGTCTGGGSDYMIAISNGTAWSCH